jgi:transposase
VKTNRRDAVTLARLHRAGELTAVWVPDPTHEAMRDLVWARTAAMETVRRARQQLQGFLLRHGRVFTGRKAWSPAHRRWLAGLRFAHPAQQIVLQEQIDAIAEAEGRRDRLGQQIRELVPDWSWRRWSPPCRRCAGWRSSRRWCWWPRSATSAASPIPAS